MLLAGGGRGRVRVRQQQGLRVHGHAHLPADHRAAAQLHRPDPATRWRPTTSRRTTPSAWPPSSVAADTSDDLRARGVDMSADDVQDDVKVVGRQDQRRGEGHRLGLVGQARRPAGEHLRGERPAPGRRTTTGSWPSWPSASLRKQFDALPAERAEPRVGPGRPAAQQHAEDAGDRGRRATAARRSCSRASCPTPRRATRSRRSSSACCSAPCSAVGLALLREQSDRRLHGADEASAAFDAPVLTTVPAPPRAQAARCPSPTCRPRWPRRSGCCR